MKQIEAIKKGVSSLRAATASTLQALATSLASEGDIDPEAISGSERNPDKDNQGPAIQMKRDVENVLMGWSPN